MLYIPSLRNIRGNDRYLVSSPQISGKWYGEEIDVHDGVSIGVMDDVCIVVNIAEIKQQVAH